MIAKKGDDFTNKTNKKFNKNAKMLLSLVGKHNLKRLFGSCKQLINFFVMKVDNKHLNNIFLNT